MSSMYGSLVTEGTTVHSSKLYNHYHFTSPCPKQSFFDYLNVSSPQKMVSDSLQSPVGILWWGYYHASAEGFLTKLWDRIIFKIFIFDHMTTGGCFVCHHIIYYCIQMQLISQCLQRVPGSHHQQLFSGNLFFSQLPFPKHD